MAVFGKPTMISFPRLNGGTDDFLIDATISLRTSLRASATSYPVQDKQFISDHVQPQPLQLSIEGMISQSPSNFFLTLASSLAGALISRAGIPPGLSTTFATAAISAGIAGAATLGNEDLSDEASFVKLLTTRGANDPDFPKNAFKGLLAMVNSGKPFTVRTFFSDTIYQNMVATSVTTNQTARTGDSLRFTLGCTKIRTVDKILTSSQTELKIADPANSSAADKKDLGEVTGKETKVEEKDTASFLTKIGRSVL